MAKLTLQVRRFLAAADPAPLLLRGVMPVTSALFCAVYSHKNKKQIDSLVAEAITAGWDVRLWCLDDGHLSDQYVFGGGQGTRLQNFNRLLVGDLSTYDMVVLSDDDVALAAGDLVRFVSCALAARLDISQPAHNPGSHVAHRLIRRRFACLWRQTTFVEVGPLVALSPGVLPRVLPFPEAGFGWGVETLWWDLHNAGLARLGIVDCTPMCHLKPAAKDYDRSVEADKADAALAERGFKDWRQLQGTVKARRFKPQF